MTALLSWRRAVVDRSPHYAGRRKLWPSTCGRYRIVWRDAAYGIALAPQYHAMICRDVGNGVGQIWELISRHRKRLAAEAACERHARRRHDDM